MGCGNATTDAHPAGRLSKEIIIMHSTTNNTIKLHFASAALAMSSSIDGKAYAGERTKSGHVKTWIAHVAKAAPTETTAEAAARVRISNVR